MIGAAAGSVRVIAVTTEIRVSNGRDSQNLEAVSTSTISSSAPASATSSDVPTEPTTPGLDQVPLEFRQDVAIAWTGREVVVWGGDIEAFNQGVSGQNRTFSDGAAFDVASGSWRMMSPGPITEVGVDHDRRTVAVDDGVVVANGTDVALWNPAANTWRSMEDLPGRSGRVDIVAGRGRQHLGDLADDVGPVPNPVQHGARR